MKEKKEAKTTGELVTESMTEAITDRELVIEAQGGNDDAFEKLVDRYDRRVLSLAFSFARNSDDAKDIYQETLIRAYKSIKKFQMKSEFSTWLYRIAANVCITFKYRQRKNESMFSRDLRSEENNHGTAFVAREFVEEEFMRAELAKQIEAALGRLSPMQRFVFTMKHYEGYLLREIASLANCSEGTAKKHLYNAVRRLQSELRGVLE